MAIPDASMDFSKFDDLNDELDFLFSSYFKNRRSVLMPSEKGWKPNTDMYETDSELVLTVDISGISSSDIKIHLQRNILILRGIRREPVHETKRKYHKMEIDFGPFERRIELPCSVGADGVTAGYSQGFLELRLPKLKEGNQQHIEIKIL